MRHDKGNAQIEESSELMSVHPHVGASEQPEASRNRRRPARARLLAAADRLLYQNGLDASGVDRIINEAGTAKGSLYGNFPSKDDLIDAYLSARHDRTMKVFHAIETSDGNATDKVDAVFDYLLSQTRDDAFRGCAFVVAAAEVPDAERPPMRWARANKRAVHESLLRILANEEVSRAQTTADQICILYDGALVTSALRPESNAVEVARQMALVLLKPG